MNRNDIIGQQIDVLDHGHVHLQNFMGGDLDIVRSARVSYDAEWRTDSDAGKDEGLIRYLMKNRHTSPFEHVQITFGIKAPIFVVRQWHRHRTWSYNEVSARYTQLPEEFYVPDPKLVGMQSESNKQMREFSVNDDVKKARESVIMIENQCREAFATYKSLIERGVPRELARSVLPVSTYTHFFASVNLHNLFHFLRLRLHEHAQYEIQVYAQAMLELTRPIAPVAVAAFEKTLKTGA